MLLRKHNKYLYNFNFCDRFQLFNKRLEFLNFLILSCNQILSAMLKTF